VDIIVASGNLFRLELTAYILAEAGYAIREAASAPALSRELAQAPAALLVLDSQLPDEDAWRAVECSGVPLLLIANARLPRTTGRLQDTGKFVLWPYQHDDLLSRVSSLTGG
jgi:DNA-binding response OmpR family regulator